MSAVLFFHPSHLQAMLLFALVISVAFGVLGRRRFAARWRYAAWTFFVFILIGVMIGWAMYPFSR